MTVTIVAEPFGAATDASFVEGYRGGCSGSPALLPSAKAAALKAKVAAFQGTAISSAQEPGVSEISPSASSEEGESGASQVTEDVAAEKAASDWAAPDKDAAERDAAEKESHLRAWLTLEPEALRADLQSNKVREIRARAVLLGATEEELDDVDESDTPKLNLIELVVQKTVANQANKSGALDDSSPGRLGMVRRLLDVYETRGKSRTHVATDGDSDVCLDGLWMHQGAPIARVAGSDLHWLDSQTVSQLVLISDGVWSMEMDGEHYEAEASRPISDLHLFWNDGEVWTKCNDFQLALEDSQSPEESAQLALEDFQSPKESAQLALSSQPTSRAINGAASKHSDSEAFLSALEKDINVTSHELAPFLQEHEGLEEVIDIEEDEERASWVLAVRQDHGKPTSHFHIGDIVEATSSLIVRRDEPLGSLQLGQLPSGSRLRVVEIGTARTGRRLRVSPLADTEFRPPQQCGGDLKCWPTRIMRESQSGWVSAVAHNKAELVRVVRHAGESSSAASAASSSRPSASTSKQPNARQRLAAALAAMEQEQ